MSINDVEPDEPHRCSPACTHAVRKLEGEAAESDRHWRQLRNTILLMVAAIVLVTVLLN